MIVNSSAEHSFRFPDIESTAFTGHKLDNSRCTTCNKFTWNIMLTIWQVKLPNVGNPWALMAIAAFECAFKHPFRSHIRIMTAY